MKYADVNFYMWSLSSFSDIKPHGLVMCHSIPLPCLPSLWNGPDCETCIPNPLDLSASSLQLMYTVICLRKLSHPILHLVFKDTLQRGIGPVTICPKVLISVLCLCP